MPVLPVARCFGNRRCRCCQPRSFACRHQHGWRRDSACARKQFLLHRRSAPPAQKSLSRFAAEHSWNIAVWTLEKLPQLTGKIAALTDKAELANLADEAATSLLDSLHEWQFHLAEEPSLSLGSSENDRRKHNETDLAVGRRQNPRRPGNHSFQYGHCCAQPAQTRCRPERCAFRRTPRKRTGRRAPRPPDQRVRPFYRPYRTNQRGLGFTLHRSHRGRRAVGEMDNPPCRRQKTTIFSMPAPSAAHPTLPTACGGARQVRC